jgi:hypothetical protein
VGKSYRKVVRPGEEHYAQPRYTRSHRNSYEEVFKCKQCRRFVCPPPSGGHHRNHCPFCLFSCHVDDRQIGDRRSTCGSRMEPIGSFQRTNGEYVLVHRCLGCGIERFNRIAADDNFEVVLALPSLSPRTAHEVKAERWEEELGLGEEFGEFEVA